MRTDAQGFFWHDLPPPKKIKKEKIKRTPPERTWERPDYLPGLDAARYTPINLFTIDELLEAQRCKEPLVYDIECYANYFLCAFMGIRSKKVIYFEMHQDCALNYEWFSWVLHNFLLVSFNGLGYDEPIATLALNGFDCAELKRATNQIIEEDWRPSDVLKARKVKRLKLDHIDLMEVAPAGGSLKIRAGRLHRKRLQDLPFHPGMLLGPDHRVITRYYCINDLDATFALHEALEQELHLRELMSEDYGLDLRSKSDAQIAEAVIGHEMERLLKRHIKRPQVQPGRRYKYNIPSLVQFQTPLMNSVLDVLRQCEFVVGDDGALVSPWQLKGLEFPIANGLYRMGIGGLHSAEEKAAHPRVKGRKKRDIDVTSYYPSVILGQRLFPEHMGEMFLVVYKKIVDRRIAAKRAGDKKTAETLKIVINGSFGKLGSMWSILYAPQLLIQVTLTGQLALLMLVEAFELAGVTVLSANTDGIVIDYADEQEEMVNDMISRWEKQTDFEMESNYYNSMYSANVNNYIAVTEDGKLKCKGWFADTGLKKNPVQEIVIDAVRATIKDGTPVEHTIRSCKEPHKFTTLRAVTGGAVCNGEYLGKVVRWYQGAMDSPEMIYAKTGNKVTGSSGGVPLMELPDELPADLNVEAYIDKANKYLEMLGYQ